MTAGGDIFLCSLSFECTPGAQRRDQGRTKIGHSFTLAARVLSWAEERVRAPVALGSPIELHPGRLRRTANSFAAVACMASEDATQFASEDANSSARIHL